MRTLKCIIEQVNYDDLEYKKDEKKKHSSCIRMINFNQVLQPAHKLIKTMDECQWCWISMLVNRFDMDIALFTNPSSADDLPEDEFFATNNLYQLEAY